MHINNHFNVVKEEMKKLEKRLCETETLSIDEITAISGQMQILQNHLFFLHSIKEIVAPDKIKRPNGLIVK